MNMLVAFFVVVVVMVYFTTKKNEYLNLNKDQNVNLSELEK